MRKKRYLFLILGLLMIVLVSGCTSKNSIANKGNPNESIEEDKRESEKDKKEKAMKKFKALISENKEPNQVIEFINENIGKVSHEDGVEMVKDFEKLQEDYIDLYTDELNKEDRQKLLIEVQPGPEFAPERVEEIENEELKGLVSRIIKGKYKLISKEGFYYPVIDYANYKEYEKFLSDELKECLNIKIIESSSPAILDGKMAVAWDELGNRLINIEKYLIKYPEGIKHEEITRLYGEYLVTYMSGTDNSPIYDTNNKKIHKNIFDNYKKIVSNNKKTITGDIINKYLELIEKNDYIIDDMVISRLVELYNESIGRLEEIK